MRQNKIYSKDNYIPYESIIGGKARGLYILKKNGFNVPEFVCVGSEVFREFLSFIGEDNKNREKLSKEFIRKIINAEIPNQIKSEIIKKYRNLKSSVEKSGHNNFSAIVRSSAIGEDSSSDSFAGIMDSFVDINSEKDLLLAVKKCWASAFSERAFSYRKKRGISQSKISVSVIIQEMINPDFSGVMFTTDDYDSISISAVKGHSADLVQGIVSGNNYQVDKKSLSIKSKEKISEIPERLIIDVAKSGKEIENKLGSSMDVEWSSKDGKLYFFQARPITIKKRGKIIWDNSNIIESYSGVTTPLTFSIASTAYYLVYKQFCEILGVDDKRIKDNDEVFRNMIGLVKGRIYYNLSCWYKLISLLPGYEYSSSWMENMMGVKEKINSQVNATGSFSNLKSFSSKSGMIYRILKNWLSLDKEALKFHNNFERVYSRYINMDFNKMDEQEIINCYLELKSLVISNWKAPIINDFSAMVFHGILKKMSEDVFGKDSMSMYHGLLSGEKGIESSEPPKKIANMARLAKNNQYKELFSNNDDIVYKKIISDKKYAKLKILLDDFITKYGYRCPGELKIEAKSYRDEPKRIIGMIRSYMDFDLLDNFISSENDKNIRKESEKYAKQKMKEKRYGYMRKNMFWFVVRNARKYTKYRENMRFARTKVFGLLRDMFNSLGRKLIQKGIIKSQSDIFYLTIDEIIDYVKGKSVMRNLKPLISKRKKEFSRYRQIKDMPERFETYSFEDLNNISFRKNNLDSFNISDENNKTLKGTGCSPGVVIANAVKVIDPSQKQNIKGKIIVAEKTDPGWVVLYPLCKGILIERGSVLSHSVIVAREMGIPIIIGINNLTKKIKTGTKIRMDANSGIIEVLR